MHNLKTRKRLTAIIMSFVLVFTIGMAFALDAGTLQFNGRIHLDPDLAVEFTNVSVTGPAGGVRSINEFEVLSGANSASSVVPAQTIEWDVTFDEAGTATINFDIINRSDEVATLALATNLDDLAAAGLIVTSNIATLPGVIGIGATLTGCTVSVEWDGTVPSDWVDATTPVHTITFTILYAPV